MSNVCSGFLKKILVQVVIVVIPAMMLWAGGESVQNTRGEQAKPAFIEASRTTEYGFGFSAGLFKVTNNPSSFEDVYGGAGLTYEGKFFHRLSNGLGWEVRAGYFSKDGELVIILPHQKKLTSTGIDATYTMIPITFSLQLDLSKLGWIEPFYMGSYWGGFGTISPFFEAGGGMYLLSEKSDAYKDADTDRESKFGYHVGGGIILRQLHAYKFFFRIDWNSISWASDAGGAAALYGEDDLGGLFIVWGLDLDLARL